MFPDEASDQQRLRVKICGVTNADDARAAIDAGADAVGLNCYRGSKRFLDLRSNSEWIEKLPARIGKVAVLVNPSWAEAVAIAALPFITALQLHGQETPAFCRRLRAEGVTFSKAIPVRDDASLAGLLDYSTETVILDSERSGAFGGTGVAFPWAIARRFVETQPLFRVILAGGLSPENVAGAVALVRPFGVDVTSGVEAGPGFKDHQRLRSFIEAARCA